MEMKSIAEQLQKNAYPGRGIILGKTPDGTKAVAAYFIMGRSSNSRNRVFVEEGQGIRTQAFDPSKLEDPSLIIYAPVRVLGNKPDAPNYTPRISGVLHVENGSYSYAMSILKSNNGNPAACNRFMFAYSTPVNGEAHFIHTYMGDGNPLPSFEGEPELVDTVDDIDEYTELLWNSLNEENKVSLFVRYINIADGTYETRIVNKNK